jgi:hypothetical protein
MIPWSTKRGLSPAAIVALVSFAELSQGCAPREIPEEVGVAEQAALNTNSLSPAALDPAALDTNTLDPDSMSLQAMSAIQDPGAAGDLARQLLFYEVSCALTASQSFAFSWTDATGSVHAEVYPGLLGLAPTWATQPLDTPGQEWVSNCLASRVNAEGVEVMLSSRGALPALAASPDELAQYQTREAVFFGNLFAVPFQVYACYDPLSMLPSQMQNRVCAQPSLLDLDLGILDIDTIYDCGPITVIGPCTQLLGLITLGYCSGQDPVERYFYGCSFDSSAPSLPSLTTFLKGPIPW